MSCLRCGSINSYQFESAESERARPAAENLPLVCRDCGLITVGGVAVSLPEQLEKAARDMAETQIEAASAAAADLEAKPDAPIEGYMANFYRVAYLDGFFRALVFFKHNAREGRLVRLREIWSKAELTGSKASRDENGYGTYDRLCIEMPEAAYTEFQQLLNLSAVPGGLNVKSSTNKRSP